MQRREIVAAMATLRACSSCGSHVKGSESSCPFCGAAFPSSGLGLTAAAVLMGLAIVACEKKGGGPNPPVEPEYGVPVTTAPGDDGGAAPDDGGGTPPDDGGGTPPDDGGGTPPDDGGNVPVEPEYGVPAEPEYGVADQG
jgi:hypothetical protein